MLRLKSLETIILAPVVALLILAGVGVYFLISKSVADFANRSIQENLSSLSSAAYEEADDEVDRCDIKGLDCLRGPQKTIHQSAVFVRFEDLARENELGTFVYDVPEKRVSFQRDVANPSDVLKQLGSAQTAVIRSPDGASFYAQSIEFKPWNWRIVLLKDTEAFSTLKEQVRNFYMGTGIVILLIAGSLAIYLRRAIARPINHIVQNLREENAPEYKGIREFEFLSDNIGEMMREVFRHRNNLEEIVEARTEELEEARSRLTDALESISEGFVLYDAADRLVRCNSKYREIMYPPGTEDIMRPGTPFEKVIRAAAERGLIWDAEGRVEEWITERLERHRNPGASYIQRRANGSWVQTSERRTERGGTVGVYTDITQIKETEFQLRELHEKAEAANRAKSEFLHGISHNFGNKLHQIMGFTGIVLDRTRDMMPPEHVKNLENALLSSKSLQLMIKELLEIARAEEGVLRILPIEFELRPIVDQCLQAYANDDKITSGAMHLVNRLTGSEPTLFTDKSKVTQVLDNLVSNAIKFTEAGKVSVSAKSEGGRVSIAVTDAGIGISEDELELVFNEFYQVTNRIGPLGTGLGLAISRKYAHLLGGELTVKSAIGVGSTFELTIPIRCRVESGRVEPLATDE